MPRSVFLGEFEQLLLLCLLKADPPYARDLRQTMTEVAGRSVSRGAVYRTLDRLEQKGYVSWEAETGDSTRDGYPRRRFRVTDSGLAAVKASRDALQDLWAGLEEVLS